MNDPQSAEFGQIIADLRALAMLLSEITWSDGNKTRAERALSYLWETIFVLEGK